MQINYWEAAARGIPGDRITESTVLCNLYASRKTSHFATALAQFAFYPCRIVQIQDSCSVPVVAAP
ncbi:hypothetical protein SLEP1_g35074 [Rubroshorea leprosula]|uniref:Uncharacterized protein n=1 Tax=Rubroshorea leprosula TaxID=152421 RepID=A0AAV5KMH9_9ROSI|nr:hypothetical protein SLEP1_g35074 [Rubroshorea leprosula]